MPEKITPDQVFELPSEVSQAETEEDGGDEVSLEEEIMHTNVQILKSLLFTGVQSPLLGTSGM